MVKNRHLQTSTKNKQKYNGGDSSTLKKVYLIKYRYVPAHFFY